MLNKRITTMVAGYFIVIGLVMVLIGAVAMGLRDWIPEIEVSRPTQQESDGDKSDGENGDSKQSPAPATPSSLVSSAGNQAESRQSHGEAKNNGGKNPENWSKEATWDWYFAAALVLFAFCQFIVGYWQWGSMSDQSAIMKSQLAQAQTAIDQTEKTLELTQQDQRAWLAPEVATLRQPFVDGEPIDMSLPMKNCGRTPGTIIKLRIVSYIEPESKFKQMVEQFEAMGLAEGGQLVIPPQAATAMRAPTTLHIIDKNNRFQIEQGFENLYIFCSFVYRDVFENEHPCKFCLEWNEKAGALWLHPQYQDYR